MDQTSITAAGIIDTFLVLLIGIGPKLALVPFLQITAPLDAATRRRVLVAMLRAAGLAALVLIVLGELLRVLLHFTVGSLSIAGGVILLVLAVTMVLGQAESAAVQAAKDPLQLALVPLAVPYLLNPVGIVGLVTVSAEAGSLGVLAVEVGVLGVVLLLDLGVFLGASRISHGLDTGRMLVIEKVFGFLIAAIAVQLVLDGLASTGVIPHLKHLPSGRGPEGIPSSPLSLHSRASMASASRSRSR
jgi:small neutral amino acid transporter SnatA (MarC family)